MSDDSSESFHYYNRRGGEKKTLLLLLWESVSLAFLLCYLIFNLWSQQKALSSVAQMRDKQWEHWFWFLAKLMASLCWLNITVSNKNALCIISGKGKDWLAIEKEKKKCSLRNGVFSWAICPLCLNIMWFFKCSCSACFYFLKSCMLIPPNFRQEAVNIIQFFT